MSEPVILTVAPMGRMVVATVNGRPVYDDCVARQSRARETRDADETNATNETYVRAALEECIDFELLAQAAEARGYSSDAEVIETRKNEVARAFIDSDFVAHFNGPEDVPEKYLRAAYNQFRPSRYYRADVMRKTQYVRVPVRWNGGPFSEVIAFLKAWIVWGAVKGIHNLDAKNFQQVGLASVTGMQMSEPRPINIARDAEGIGPVFFRTLWSPTFRPGTVHTPVRTKWGWDVIMYIEELQPLDISFEEAAPELREEIYVVARQRSFQEWLEPMVSAANIDEARLKQLAQADAPSYDEFSEVAPNPAPAAPTKTATPTAHP